LEQFGWDVELTPETRDGGYDILAVSKSVDGSGLRASYIIECKKYRPDRRVGIAVARQLLHVKSERGASHAIIATTSDFTSGVYDFAAQRLDFDPKNAGAVIEWCKMYIGRFRRLTLPKGHISRLCLRVALLIKMQRPDLTRVRPVV
jgi:restriction system protein